MKIRRDRLHRYSGTAIFSSDIGVQEGLGIADTIGRSGPALNEGHELGALRFGQINTINFIHAALWDAPQ